MTGGGAVESRRSVGGWSSEPCYAKLNLFLDVRGRRPDGYHELCTVFHEIDLADRLLVRTADGGTSGGTSGAALVRVEAGSGPGALAAPTGGDNLAVRAAAALLREAGSSAAVEIALDKHIPIGAGLGGGSADAAAALRAVDRLLDLRTPDADLHRIAAGIGSDVAFLVRGGTALGRGRGEELTPLPVGAVFRFALVIPPFGAATPAVYRALPRDLAAPVSERATLDALERGDPDALTAAVYNALQPAAEVVEPRLRELRDGSSAALGLPVHLTGSGSTLFAVLSPSAPLAPTSIGATAVVLAQSSGRSRAL